MSETELKALAYDQLAQIEQAQTNLKAINQQLVMKQSQPTMNPIGSEAAITVEDSVKDKSEDKSKKAPAIKDWNNADK